MAYPEFNFDRSRQVSHIRQSLDAVEYYVVWAYCYGPTLVPKKNLHFEQNAFIPQFTNSVFVDITGHGSACHAVIAADTIAQIKKFLQQHGLQAQVVLQEPTTL